MSEARDTLVCEWCGDSFARKPHPVERRTGWVHYSPTGRPPRFCSTTCRVVAHRCRDLSPELRAVRVERFRARRGSSRWLRGDRRLPR